MIGIIMLYILIMCFLVYVIFKIIKLFNLLFSTNIKLVIILGIFYLFIAFILEVCGI
jgi:hypothetical protein